MDAEALKNALFDRILTQAAEKSQKTGTEVAADRIHFFTDRRTDLLLPFLIEIRAEWGNEDEITDQEMRAANARQMRFANTRFREMMRVRLEMDSQTHRDRTLAGIAALTDLGELMEDQEFLAGNEEALMRVTKIMTDQAGRYW